MNNMGKHAAENADDEGRPTGPNADEADTKEKLEQEAEGRRVEPNSGGNTEDEDED